MKKRKKIARDHTICINIAVTISSTRTQQHVASAIWSDIRSYWHVYITCTRNYLVSSLLYSRPLSRYALYYYIMAESHVADNQTCVLCVVHCAVCACLKHAIVYVWDWEYVEIFDKNCKGRKKKKKKKKS